MLVVPKLTRLLKPSVPVPAFSASELPAAGATISTLLKARPTPPKLPVAVIVPVS